MADDEKAINIYATRQSYVRIHNSRLPNVSCLKVFTCTFAQLSPKNITQSGTFSKRGAAGQGRYILASSFGVTIRDR